MNDWEYISYQQELARINQAREAEEFEIREMIGMLDRPKYQWILRERFGMRDGKAKSIIQIAKAFGVKRYRLERLQRKAKWRLARIFQSLRLGEPQLVLDLFKPDEKPPKKKQRPKPEPKQIPFRPWKHRDVLWEFWSIPYLNVKACVRRPNWMAERIRKALFRTGYRKERVGVFTKGKCIIRTCSDLQSPLSFYLVVSK